MVEVKVLREENLAAAEQLYVASVRDNPQGFIQQLHLFPNRHLSDRLNATAVYLPAFLKTGKLSEWAVSSGRATERPKSVNFMSAKSLRGAGMAKSC